MKVRNGNTPIPLPEIVRNGDAITARWANGIRLALERLRDRTPIAVGFSSFGASDRFPFEISARTASIVAEAGTMSFTTIDSQIEEAPADGIWYLEAKCVIDATTGNIDSNEVYWTQTEGADTTTDHFITVGQIEVIDTVPDSTTIVQYNYGPLYVAALGGISAKWDVSIY